MTDYICTKCDYQGKRKGVKPGSTLMEILLWVVLLIPGPFYSIWRILAKKYVCPICGEQTMVKTDSPLGKRKLQMIEDDLSPESLANIPDRWEKDREEYAKKHGEDNSGEKW